MQMQAPSPLPPLERQLERVRRRVDALDRSAAAARNWSSPSRATASAAYPKAKSKSGTADRGSPEDVDEVEGREDVREKRRLKYLDLREEFFGSRYRDYKQQLMAVPTSHLPLKVKRKMLLANWNLRTRRINLQMKEGAEGRGGRK
mmetsp:Transcript_23937/g.60409  ORF Transcript_23937/g.60409 Transcript_23937/m.60409 type:complete len:146 (+) Transcript_23937:65-502(+)